jgi:hypothetical protein
VIEMTPSRLRAFIRDIRKPAGEFGCWEWIGARNGNGYGSSCGSDPAHRVAYSWLVGPIPEGQELDHTCRNRACVNPHHLEPVSRSENRKRICEYGPREFRPYCKRGHALVRGNARRWSDGRDRPERIYCRICHDGENRKMVREGMPTRGLARFARGAA